MANVFFTSDLHLGHDNLLDFRSHVHGKLFNNSEQMNEWIIEKWNSRVRPRDLVWVLGDIAWGSDNLHYFAQMNGTKRLILGNHDNFSILEYYREFDKVYGAWKKYGFVMTHVPIHPQEMKYRNWNNNIHGHIHHKEKLLQEPQYICVNIDVRNGLPMSLDEIRDLMSRDYE